MIDLSQKQKRDIALMLVCWFVPCLQPIALVMLFFVLFDAS
jgi:hypothetical protein